MKKARIISLALVLIAMTFAFAVGLTSTTYAGPDPCCHFNCPCGPAQGSVGIWLGYCHYMPSCDPLATLCFGC